MPQAVPLTEGLGGVATATSTTGANDPTAGGALKKDLVVEMLLARIAVSYPMRPRCHSANSDKSGVNSEFDKTQPVCFSDALLFRCETLRLFAEAQWLPSQKLLGMLHFPRVELSERRFSFLTMYRLNNCAKFR